MLIQLFNIDHHLIILIIISKNINATAQFELSKEECGYYKNYWSVSLLKGHISISVNMVMIYGSFIIKYIVITKM